MVLIKCASLLKGGKSFAKRVMERAGVPTASFEVFDNFEKALSYGRERGAPLVVKVDGLCAGKGVFVCKTLEETERALKKIFIE